MIWGFLNFIFFSLSRSLKKALQFQNNFIHCKEKQSLVFLKKFHQYYRVLFCMHRSLKWSYHEIIPSVMIYFLNEIAFVFFYAMYFIICLNMKNITSLNGKISYTEYGFRFFFPKVFSNSSHIFYFIRRFGVFQRVPDPG